ncbi:hypothetical protein TNCV_1139281 [Trichonephila clavipes]|nr:hypothetical protein TNCV_1139281 [Trichonephila clavipes]
MAAILNLTTSFIKVIRHTPDAIHNAANQDLHLVAHLVGPVRKTKTCDLRRRLEKSLQTNEVNSSLYAVNDLVIPGNEDR